MSNSLCVGVIPIVVLRFAGECVASYLSDELITALSAEASALLINQLLYAYCLKSCLPHGGWMVGGRW